MQLSAELPSMYITVALYRRRHTT